MKRLAYALLFMIGIYLGLPGTPGTPYQTQALAGARPGDPLLTIFVYHAAQGKVIRMDLEEYVKGVVASEMPASFSSEALKAQAIVARTNAVRKMAILGGTPSRSDADVSSDPKVDQAWDSVDALRERWGAVG